MMLMGDEYGHTRLGNNNSYGHDNALNHFQWGQVCVSLIFSLPWSFLSVYMRLKFDGTAEGQEGNYF